MEIIAIIFYAFIIVPLIYTAVFLRKAREYCERRGWRFMAEFFAVLGYPISVFEKMF